MLANNNSYGENGAKDSNMDQGFTTLDGQQLYELDTNNANNISGYNAYNGSTNNGSMSPRGNGSVTSTHIAGHVDLAPMRKAKQSQLLVSPFLLFRRVKSSNNYGL